MTKIDLLFEKAKSLYDNGDPSHDLAHIRRVMATCLKIGKIEGADLDILLAGAILHDVVNVPKNHPDRLKASQMAADQAVSLLNQAGFSADETKLVYQVIIEHSFSLGKKPTSIESAVLQDADKLDGLGAVGVMRTVTCGARMGASYYNENEPFADTRELNDRTYTIDHFYAKLLKLRAMMNTESAKLEADRRHEFMLSFLEQLKSEIGI